MSKPRTHCSQSHLSEAKCSNWRALRVALQQPMCLTASTSGLESLRHTCTKTSGPEARRTKSRRLPHPTDVRRQRAFLPREYCSSRRHRSSNSSSSSPSSSSSTGSGSSSSMLAPGGSPETMSWYKRRTCCKSSKVPQIPLILHLRNIAMLLGTCCLRAYLWLGSTHAKMLETRFRHTSNNENMRKLEVLSSLSAQ